jgi:hypothetical protein
MRMMRSSLAASALLAAVAAFSPGTLRAQVHAEGGDFAYPGRPEYTVPIPTGNPSQDGFYFGLEYLFYDQSWTLGDQNIAFRGLVDSSGLLTGQPGTFIGSREVALSTSQLKGTSLQPGWRATLGYKFSNGVAAYINFMQTIDQTFSGGASLATNGFANQIDLANSYLFSPVFNFTPDYAGPLVKTGFDVTAPNAGGNFYGIWNGATIMSLAFTQRFTAGEIGARVPMLQTDYSRVYGLGGARYAWFYNKLEWRTVATDVVGRAFPSDTAEYTNYLSQRMYGPFAGCGHEVYMGKRFAVSLDVTGALLMSIVKERAYYELGDKTTKIKNSANEFDLVPNANVDINFMWYPIEGVQMKIGYTFQGYFNTRNMEQPVAFNYGQLRPDYGNQAFRYVQGLNIGFGLFF